MKRKRKRRLRFIDLPQKTLTGVLCGIVSILTLIILIIISTVNKGQAGIGIGVAGMLAFIINIIGMTMTVKGIQESENMFFTLPLLGLVFNGIMLVVYLVLYVVGIF